MTIRADGDIDGAQLSWPGTVQRPPSLSDTIADRITDFLITNNLGPGDKLPTEPEIAALFDVSRTVVREAGRLLAGRGVVDIRPGRGMVVADFDGSSLARQYRLLLDMKQGTFEQMMDLRLTLEVGMCRFAAQRRTDGDLETMYLALSEFDSEAEHLAALNADLDFHRVVASAAQNPFFDLLVMPINRYLRRAYRESLGYLAARQQTADEHRAIADAISAQQPETAAELMRQHLERVQRDQYDLVTKQGGGDNDSPH